MFLVVCEIPLHTMVISLDRSFVYRVVFVVGACAGVVGLAVVFALGLRFGRRRTGGTHVEVDSWGEYWSEREEAAWIWIRFTSRDH
jgi:hypothetical protein